MPRKRHRCPPRKPCPVPGIGIERVAKILGISVTRAKALVAKGMGPESVARGTRVYYPLNKLRQFVEEELARRQAGYASTF